MREILFRGKRIDNGEWVEGNLVITKDEHIIIPTTAERLGGAEFNKFELIDPATVGQYTGLIDKNGKKIFEGDIVRYGNVTGVVNWSIGCFSVRNNDPRVYRGNPAIDIILNEYPNEIKIIGNIHDNPELLGGVKVNG